jgi:hypothetical protein
MSSYAHHFHTVVEVTVSAENIPAVLQVQQTLACRSYVLQSRHVRVATTGQRQVSQPWAGLYKPLCECGVTPRMLAAPSFLRSNSQRIIARSTSEEIPHSESNQSV